MKWLSERSLFNHSFKCFHLIQYFCLLRNRSFVKQKMGLSIYDVSINKLKWKYSKQPCVENYNCFWKWFSVKLCEHSMKPKPVTCQGWQVSFIWFTEKSSTFPQKQLPHNGSMMGSWSTQGEAKRKCRAIKYNVPTNFIDFLELNRLLLLRTFARIQSSLLVELTHRLHKLRQPKNFFVEKVSSPLLFKKVIGSFTWQHWKSFFVPKSKSYK